MSVWMHGLFLVLVVFNHSLSLAQPRVEWARVYNDADSGRSGTGFKDIFALDGSYAFCGAKGVNISRSYTKWILLTEAESGNVQVELTRQQGDQSQAYESLVQADNGDVVAAGHNNGVNGGDVAVLRINPEGEEIWLRFYNGNEYQRADAIIELKDDNFLIAGASQVAGRAYSDGYLLKISPEGELIWDRSYGQHNRAGNNYFLALRETENGVLLAGESLDDAWLLKVDADGEPVWSQTYHLQNQEHIFESFSTLISTSDGGFLAGGGARISGSFLSEFFVARVNGNGDLIWQRNYYPLEDEGFHQVRGAVRLPDGGFALCGEYIGHCGTVQGISEDGEPLWTIQYGIEDIISCGGLKSIVIDADGGLLVAGRGGINGVRGGLVIKITPERFAPLIVEYEPEELTQRLLLNDTLLFHLHAEDAQNDSIIYRYFLDGELVVSDSDAIIPFPNQGSCIVTGIASDAQSADSVVWHVTVSDFFIQSYYPDTLDLTLRRGSFVDFEIDSVAAIDGDDVQYQWTLNDLDRQEQVSGGDAQATTVEFSRSGHYIVEGMAYRGNSHDEVVWDVEVKGAIWAFLPEELQVETLEGENVEFQIIPTISDTLNWFTWFYDGGMIREGRDSVFVMNLFELGEHTITGILADTVESDTVEWVVNVLSDFVGQGGQDARPTEFGIESVSPNPFNSMLTINFTVPGFGDAGLRVYDLSGREVARLLDNSKLQTPNSKLIWDASEVPAGVYLVRLQQGTQISTRKVVLLR